MCVGVVSTFASLDGEDRPLSPVVEKVLVLKQEQD